uniref:Putative secreted protein n=1 Tax=Ixodes ricinus TaxID=34613 RepID=A0A147BUJ9_IXORI
MVTSLKARLAFLGLPAIGGATPRSCRPQVSFVRANEAVPAAAAVGERKEVSAVFNFCLAPGVLKSLCKCLSFTLLFFYRG